MVIYNTAQTLGTGPFNEPVLIYCGLAGQIGDIVMYSATLRRIAQIFPNGRITLAVSKKYREAGELLAGLPYVHRLFVAELYFEKQSDVTYGPWHLGWPVDLRGDDEVAEQRQHDIILETRPRHRRMPWWEFDHQVAELAYMVGVPGPIDLRTEICIPDGTEFPSEAAGRIVLHNDPNIDATKAWPWEAVREFVAAIGAENVVLLGNPGEPVPGAIDLRGRTTLCQAAAIIAACRCYVGIDSGLMWIAGSLQVPAVGLYGTTYLPCTAWHAIQPVNPNAKYLGVEGPVGGIKPSDVLNALEEVMARR
jgi:heptosyltransferase-3